MENKQFERDTGLERVSISDQQAHKSGKRQAAPEQIGEYLSDGVDHRPIYSDGKHVVRGSRCHSSICLVVPEQWGDEQGALAAAHTPNLIVHGCEGGSGAKRKVGRDAGGELADAIPHEFLLVGIKSHV
jgi:hypothetical protein